METGQIRKLRVCDVVAEALEEEARSAPDADAAYLRRKAAEWRTCINPAYQKVITEAKLTKK